MLTPAPGVGLLIAERLIPAFSHVVEAARGTPAAVYVNVLLDQIEMVPEPATRSGCYLATTVAGRSSLEAGKSYSVTEAAQLIGCSRQAVLHAIGRNRLPARKVGPIWMITRSDLDTYRYREPRMT